MKCENSPKHSQYYHEITSEHLTSSIGAKSEKNHQIINFMLEG